MKSHDIQECAWSWRIFELREVTLTQKEKHCFFSLICRSWLTKKGSLRGQNQGESMTIHAT